MKLKKYVVIILLFLLSITVVHAATLHDYFPSGKNYLDENNILFDRTSLQTKNPFRVKSDTTYTFSFPGYALLENPSVVISDLQGEYFINGNIQLVPECFYDEQLSYCTFTTNPDSTHIELFFDDAYLNLFHSTYGFTDFQLEEGSAPTSYEEYIPPYVDSNGPEFSGSGAFVKSYNETYPLSMIITNHIVVVDDIDGDLTSSIVIESDDYTGNESVVGEYQVVLSATDNAGNSSYFNLNVIVKDEVLPLISGPTDVYVNIDESKSLNDIITENITASDEYDGTISIETIIDNYTENSTVLGVHAVTIKAVDSSLNEVEFVFNIHVEDVTGPTIVESTNVTVQMSSPKTIAEILNQFTLNDNYDTPDDLTLNIINDDYTGNENIPGDYTIDVEILDTSLNKSLETINISLVDNIAPTITGPATYTFSYTQEKNVDDIRSLLSVSDNVTVLALEDLVVTIDELTGNSNNIGNYVVEFQATDEFGNQIAHQIVVSVIDDVAPVIFIDNYVVTLSAASTFNENDALNLLLNSNELFGRNYTIIKLLDEYSGNENKPGTYQYNLKFSENDTGEEYIKEFLIKVETPQEESADPGLIVRNIAVYSMVLGLIVVVAIKSKK